MAQRPEMLDEHAGWIAERFTRHHGNADVVRQDLALELGVVTSLRTMERAAIARGSNSRRLRWTGWRFEMPPDRQL